MSGNLVIGQSGGATAVINASLVGAVQEAMASNQIDGIYGMQHGIEGLVNGELIDLRQQPSNIWSELMTTPSAALGSCRYKLKDEDPERIIQIMCRYNIRYLVYIGGNDSADTARIVGELATKNGHDLKVFHIPKTIDNDLRVHDHTPGYGSAARFVACAMMGDNYDNRSLPGIKVDVIMGRHAGFLTAASVLARQHAHREAAPRFDQLTRHRPSLHRDGHQLGCDGDLHDPAFAGHGLSVLYS